MTNLYKKKSLGQTLIEVMATVLFISVGVLALIRFQNYLAYDNSLAQQKADATLLAINQIETQRDFHVLSTTAGYNAYSDIASTTTTATSSNTTFTITSTVTTFTSPNYKRIAVTVSWTDRANTAQSVQMVSYVAGVEPSNSAPIM